MCCWLSTFGMKHDGLGSVCILHDGQQKIYPRQSEAPSVVGAGEGLARLRLPARAGTGGGSEGCGATAGSEIGTTAGTPYSARIRSLSLLSSSVVSFSPKVTGVTVSARARGVMSRT